jgi:hypothetical protein
MSDFAASSHSSSVATLAREEAIRRRRAEKGLTDNKEEPSV